MSPFLVNMGDYVPTSISAPPDIITQQEIEHLADNPERTLADIDALARRLLAGATVEPGRFDEAMLADLVLDAWGQFENDPEFYRQQE